jgi:hypothetical protein
MHQALMEKGDMRLTNWSELVEKPAMNSKR